MADLSNITAAILAGGFGTRLRSVVSDKSKVLAVVNGRPFISYLLDDLALAGVKRVILCTGYRGEQVEAELGAAYRGMELSYSRETSPLGTAGALRNAIPLLQDNRLIVMNGDSYFETDLPTFADLHGEKDATCSMALVHVPDTTRYGRVELDENLSVRHFIEKGEGRGPGTINAGIYLFERHVIDRIPPHREVSLEREILPALIGDKFFGFSSTGRFIDIGTPESYREAEQFFTGLRTRLSRFPAEERP
ncbi:nucleotidyltransferase family protein [Geobacter sp.]|uniref:nucleotidyltransferase family protein n=1 Tax=Geobacter sp. TaxID=46610 RepID=UPI00262B1B46|nr:nucleotidyltransferase family protein [Geobacter sp.]